MVYGLITHSTPLECKNFGIQFSIDLALRWSAGLVIKSVIDPIYCAKFSKFVSRTHVNSVRGGVCTWQVAMSNKRHQSQIGTEATSLLPPLAIGVILILLNAYWIALVGGIHHSLNPAYASLFIAPIVNLFFAVMLNTLLKRIRPQLALSRAQLLLVY